MNPITTEYLAAAQKVSLGANKKIQKEREDAYYRIRPTLRFYFKQHIYQRTNVYVPLPIHKIHESLQKEMEQAPTANAWFVPMFLAGGSFRMSDIQEDLGRTIHFKDLTDTEFIERAFVEAVADTHKEWLQENFPCAKIVIQPSIGGRHIFLLSFELGAAPKPA